MRRCGLTGSAQDIAAHPIEYQQADLEALDHELGRLVGSMNATTRANTTVIFMGDNGTASLAVQPPIKADRAKTTVYQGGVTVPFVVSGAGVTRVGQREAALINGVDMFATVADLTGLGLQDANDGRSFGPLLSSASGPHRDFAYTEYFVGSTRASGAGPAGGGPAGGGPGGDAAGRRAAASGWAIRDDRYKLIELQTSGRQLYDLVNDPWETRDLLLTPTADALAKAESLAAVALTLRSSSVTVR